MRPFSQSHKMTRNLSRILSRSLRSRNYMRFQENPKEIWYNSIRILCNKNLIGLSIIPFYTFLKKNVHLFSNSHKMTRNLSRILSRSLRSRNYMRFQENPKEIWYNSIRILCNKNLIGLSIIPFYTFLKKNVHLFSNSHKMTRNLSRILCRSLRSRNYMRFQENPKEIWYNSIRILCNKNLIRFSIIPFYTLFEKYVVPSQII